MYSIILIVVFLFVVFRQNSRISDLEKRVDKLFKASSSPASEDKSEISGAQPISTAEAMITDKPKIATVATPKIAPEISETKSEEASGKLLGTIGIIAVFLGAAFFLKYAFDNNWVGPAGRVMIGVIAGMGFIGVGQFLRKKYLQYSDFLIGGGIAILYLSVYSAQAYYHLISPVISGLFMFAVTVLAFAISIVNATEVLGLLAVVGGFLTPTLSGARENNMLMLFGYLTILNAGVLGVSMFKHWPRLVAVAFIGAIVNFMQWKDVYYRADVLIPTLGFLLITFLIFLIASIARAGELGTKASRSDFFLLGANALVFSVLFYELLDANYHSVIGFSFVVLSLIYMGVAYVANKANPDDHALNIFLPGIAVTFLSVAVPMQLDGAWVAVAWLVESCVLYYIASMISNRGFQVMGVVVYILGALNFLSWHWSGLFSLYQKFVPIFNKDFAVMLVGILAAYAIAYMYFRFGSVTAEVRQRGITAFVIVANIITIYALTIQIGGFYENKIIALSEKYSMENRDASLFNSEYGYQNTQLSSDYYEKLGSLRNQSNTAISIFWALYAALLTAIGFVKRFVGPRRFGLVLFVITGLKVLFDVWSLGEIYRIVSFIIFGLIALAASFAYAKYKDRLKAIIVLALIFVSGFTFNSAQASVNLTDWQYKRAIGTQQGLDFVKVVLPENLSKSTDDFRDIRIVNQNGDETPYVLSRGSVTSGGIVPVKILNKSTVSGKTQFIADAGAGNEVRTRIELSTDSKNFKRQVSVYASNTLLPISSGSWALLTNKGYVFKFTDDVTGFSSGKSEIDFPANTSRYFKVVIDGGDEGPVDVFGAVIYGDVTKIIPTYTKNVVAQIHENSAKKTTEITFDLGERGILINAANVESSDKNYNRKVVVESSDDGESWRYISQGYISSVLTPLFSGTSNRLIFPEQNSRFIRLSVVNDDNRPLAFSQSGVLEGPVISLIFETRKNESYSLYYSNPTARRPVYDLSRISAYISENSIPVALLSGESVNPTYVAPKAPVVPFTETYPWLLNALLVLVVVVIIGGVIAYLWHYKKTHSDLGNGSGFNSNSN